MQPRPSLTLRKPSSASPEAVAAFVAGSEGASAPAPVAPTIAVAAPTIAVAPTPVLRAVPAEAPAARTADAPSFRRASRAVVERRTRPARRRTTVYLDVDVASELAETLRARDQELSDAVNRAVRAWLEANR